MEIHPQTVHFPVAFIIGAFVSLAIYAYHKDIFFRRMGFVLHGVGSLGMVIAIITGRIASNQIANDSHASEVLKWHEISSYISIVLNMLFWIWMYLRLYKMNHKELIILLIAYTVALGSMIYTAYLGGTLVYSYGVGMP